MRASLISLYDPENNGVRILADYLRRRGHQAQEVYFKDWKNNGLIWPSAEEIASLVRCLREYRAEIIGVSLRASAYLKVFTFVVERLREELGVPVLVGGGHATMAPESLTDVCDYVIRGEAEDPVADLLDRLDAGLPADDLDNVWSCAGGQVRRNELRPLRDDLEQISRRDFLHADKVVIDGAHISTRDPMLDDTMYLIMDSRGCPYACSFCNNSKLQRLYHGKGRYWRLRPVDDVIGELVQARPLFRRMRRVRFDDEVFPLQSEWLDPFAAAYERQVGLPFEILLEPRAFKEAQARRLVAAGLDTVYMGIQANERISRELYDRDADHDHIVNTARACHELGIDTRFHVMIDDPYTTDDDRKRLFDLLNRLPRPFRLYMFSMTVMPGTDLAQKLMDEGLIGPDDVEGAATKTFKQYRMSLDWDRPDDERFWIAMMVLVNKRLWHPALLQRMSRSGWLRRHPGLLTRVAAASNMLSMVGVVPVSIARGELDLRMLRRFWTPGKWITA